MNEVESKFEKFVNWINTEKAGDVPVIVGGEIFVLSIVLLWKFFDSSWSIILRNENYVLFLCIVIGLIVISITNLILIIYGLVIKLKRK